MTFLGHGPLRICLNRSSAEAATQKLFVTNSAIIRVKTLLCTGFESSWRSTERASGYELGVREGGMAGADVPNHPKEESGKL